MKVLVRLLINWYPTIIILVMYISLNVKMERQKHKLPIESEWQEKVAEIVWFTASVFKTRQCIPHDT
jgi:hypothetical protein